MPRRYSESCLQVYIYKTNRQVRSLHASNPADMREVLVLNTVTSVALDSEIIYDEGETRPIRKDIVLTLEAIISPNSDSEFGDSWEYGNERPADTARIQPDGGDQPPSSTFMRGGNPLYHQNMDSAALITFIEEYLSTPGLTVDLSHYPSTITSIIPSVSIKSIDSAHVPQADTGYLVDSFNGPRPLSVQIIPLTGGNSFRLVWKVKFSTSLQGNNNYGSSSLNLVDLSSEIRMDIDKDGDLTVIVAGTMYAPNPKTLYKARRELNVLTTPLHRQFEIEPATEDGEAEVIDVFAQVNGFYRETTFNVEKSGRSAKFTVTYSQVKSNSAHPHSIRDIEFSQEISSSLFGESPMDGMGFTTWKQSFTGRIRIPHRFNANYAWFVIFHLIAERTRKLKQFSTIGDVASASSALTNVAGDRLGEERYGGGLLAKVRGIPVAMRLKHNIFKREVDFTIDYFVVCPLNYVMSATCLFERANNDYYTRYQMPRGNDGKLSEYYRPKKLSQQWINWMQTTFPEYAFDPQSANGMNPLGSNQKFHDNAGTEIIDGGHEIDPFVAGAGMRKTGTRQLHSFVTTVADPHEEDPDYALDRQPDMIFGMHNVPLPTTTGSLPAVINYGSDETNATTSAQNVLSPSSENNNINALVKPSEQIDPRFSWIKHEESYIVRSTHPTVPTEALSEVTKDWHGEPKLYRQFVSNGSEGSGASPNPPAEVPDLAGNTRHIIEPLKQYSEGGTNIHPEENNPIQRETYALKGSRFYITVKGYAIRVGYPIAIPTVTAIAGYKAIKVGDGRSMITPMGLQGNLPVYYAAWEQTYTVDKSLEGVDILQSIESTGASIFYA